MKYVAVGDIHGCDHELNNLLRACRARNLTGSDVTYVFLGDYGDRGPNTKGVVERLMHFNTLENCVFLMGNHDEMLLDYLDGRGQWGFMANGGDTTLKSYGINPDAAAAYLQFPDNHRAWFSRLHLKYEVDGLFFVHAGIDPYLPLNDQNREDLLWIRDEFLNYDEDHGKLIVHGHTPGDTIDLRPNRCNLDTSCVFGGALTAGIFEEGKFKDYVQVKSEYDYLAERRK